MRDRKRWFTPDHNVVGMKEASDILGIQKMTLHRWMQPKTGGKLDFGGFGPDRTYMCSWVETAATPVWDRRDVERHRDEIGRQRGPSTDIDDQ